MKYNYFIIVILFAVLRPGYTQEKNSSGAQSLDVTHVSIDLQFDRQQKQAIGNVVIDALATESISTISLDAAKLQVNQNYPFPSLTGIDRLNTALAEKQTDDIFEQVLFLSMLGDERGVPVIRKLKDTFRGNEPAIIALDNYEQQLITSLKK